MKRLKKFRSYLLSADIGGTNTRFGVFGSAKSPELIFSFKFPTKNIDLVQAINLILEFSRLQKITIKKACFAVAGEIENQDKPVKLSNCSLKIDKKQLIRKTRLTTINIINDFQAIAYSLPYIKTKTIKKGKHYPEKPKAIIGAGTGLGKAVAIPIDKYYIILRSEGGHADIRMDEIIFKNKTYVAEDIVSGKGLSLIFDALPKTTAISRMIRKHKNNPYLISNYRKKDKVCKKTFQIFSKYYARAVKNFALNAFALGGIYIAGSLSLNNPDIFNTIFKKELTNSDKVGKNIMKNITIYLITDDLAGLKGAAIQSSPG